MVKNIIRNQFREIVICLFFLLIFWQIYLAFSDEYFMTIVLFLNFPILIVSIFSSFLVSMYYHYFQNVLSFKEEFYNVLFLTSFASLLPFVVSYTQHFIFFMQDIFLSIYYYGVIYALYFFMILYYYNFYYGDSKKDLILLGFIFVLPFMVFILIFPEILGDMLGNIF